MKGYDFITTLVKEKIFANQHLRPFDIFVKEHFDGKLIVGAEIGVLAGCHAYSMLSHNPNIYKLYLIDPYLNYPTYEENYKEQGLSNCYNVAKKKLSIFNNRIIWIKKMFQEATDDVPMLDFCYFDIDGDYIRTKEFIDMYWGKIKEGGVIGGWNYDANKHHTGVVKVVMEFCKNYGYELDGDLRDWWIIKEGK